MRNYTAKGPGASMQSRGINTTSTHTWQIGQQRSSGQNSGNPLLLWASLGAEPLPVVGGPFVGSGPGILCRDP